MKFNIYKIIKENETALITKLTSSKMILSGEKEIEKIKMKFYFSENPDSVDIWWVEKYKDFLQDDHIEKLKNKLYYGVLILSSDNFCYAISLGKSHFYLKSYCDIDFGLSLAERIANEDQVRLKNSKFFKSKKNKVITSFQNENEFIYDAGEAISFLRSETIDEKLWGKIASFGHSVLLSIDIVIDELPNLIYRIENKLGEKKLFNIPKIEKILDKEIIFNLDKELINYLNSDETEEISDDIKLFGINIVFSQNYEYSFYFNGTEGEKFGNESFLFNFKKFIKDNSISLDDFIKKIKIKIYKEDSKCYTENFIKFLDFVSKEKDNYCLTDGNWYTFNQSYIDYMSIELNKIHIEEREEYQNFLSLKETLKISFLEDNKKDPYGEDLFNYYCGKNGYDNGDRDIETLDKKYKIEKMDLYKDNTLFFVKIGNPQKLGYVIDQANNTVKYLQKNKGEININGENKKIENICLWLIIDRKTKITSLSELNSIIFNMKLVDWRKNVLDAGYNPKVYINYKN